MANPEGVSLVGSGHRLKKRQRRSRKPACHPLALFSRKRGDETELLAYLPETINDRTQSQPRSIQYIICNLKKVKCADTKKKTRSRETRGEPNQVKGTQENIGRDMKNEQAAKSRQLPQQTQQNHYHQNNKLPLLS